MSSLLLLGDQTTFCFEAQPILSIVGWILTIFKIAIPLIIIIIGMFDLGKAAVSSKPEEIKKSVTSLVWRFVGGVAIFFIPSIVMLAFGFVSGFSKAQDQLGEANWKSCYSCIVRPWNAECTCQGPTKNYCDV